MKAFPVLLFFALTNVFPTLQAQTSDAVRQMEISGDTMGARAALARAAADSPSSIPALTAYAEFLDRYDDPGCREAYRKLLTAVRSSGDSAHATVIAGRLAASA